MISALHSTNTCLVIKNCNIIKTKTNEKSLNNAETEIKVMALLCKSCFNQLLSKHCWPGFICPLYNMKKLELCRINKSYQNCYSSYLHPLVYSSLKNVRYPVS